MLYIHYLALQKPSIALILELPWDKKYDGRHVERVLYIHYLWCYRNRATRLAK
jgi:hypothetical protein